VLLRSFVLERQQGNLIVYNSPGVSESAAAIRDLGAPARLLVNHGHESMYGQPDLEVPVRVHEKGRAEVAASLDVAGTFDRRGMIDDDLEVIPTPATLRARPLSSGSTARTDSSSPVISSGSKTASGRPSS